MPDTASIAPWDETNRSADHVSLHRLGLHHYQRALAHWVIRDHGRRRRDLHSVPHLRHPGMSSISCALICPFNWLYAIVLGSFHFIFERNMYRLDIDLFMDLLA